MTDIDDGTRPGGGRAAAWSFSDFLIARGMPLRFPRKFTEALVKADIQDREHLMRWGAAVPARRLLRQGRPRGHWPRPPESSRGCCGDGGDGP
jgi:hypothetical protein